MKALNLYGVNKLVFDEIDYPVCGQDEVILKVKAVGICGSDIPRVFDKGTYHFPTVIGHEFSGKIVESTDPDLIGKGAAVIPLLPCKKCNECKTENYAQCESYNYYGSRCNGGMSQYIAVKKDNLVIMPKEISYLEAAMCEPAAVALHALKKANFRDGQTIAIFGIGPIGLIIAQWAVAFGAKKVIMVARNEEKVALAKKMGFVDVMNSMLVNVKEEILGITNGKGVDVCIEGTGTSGTLENCLFAAKNFGKVIALGNPLGKMELSQAAYWNILRREIKIIGVWNSKFNSIENDWKDVLLAMQTKQINVLPLITHKFLLKDYEKAFKIMREKQEMYCKVMFIDNIEEVK